MKKPFVDAILIMSEHLETYNHAFAGAAKNLTHMLDSV